MKTLQILRGAYAGRVLLLEDGIAASAESDGWARPVPEEGIEGERVFEEGTNLADLGDKPQSLVDFEAGINRGGTSDQPSPPPTEGEGGGGPGPGPDVAPVLDSIEPTTVALNDPDVTLHCYGSGFTQSSVIMFANQPEPIVFVSDTEVTTIVKPSLPWGAVTVQVLVRNGTAESNALDFTFTEAAAAGRSREEPSGRSERDDPARSSPSPSREGPRGRAG